MSNTWDANYIIVGVHQEDEVITEVKAYELIKKSDGKFRTSEKFMKYSKQRIISLINSGFVIYSARIEDDKFYFGSQVLVYGNDRYIRTDKNNIKGDNLENLPQY